jgi:diguanylate cyclase (GGDEF)-like protein
MALVLYGLVALVFILLVSYILYQKRKMDELMDFMDFHRRTVENLGILVVRYQVSQDRAVLSRDLSRMLGLPEEIKGIEKLLSGRTRVQPEDPEYPVLAAIESFGRDLPWQMVRQGMAPRHFLIHSYVMNDSKGNPSYIIGAFRDITSQVNEETKLAVMAQFDGLTRVHNSGASRSWLKSNVGKKPGGALYILDIDHFKEVNDTIGHQGGDQALVSVANALRQALAGHGFIGRLGGDEFVIFVSDYDRQKAEKLAQSVHQYVESLTKGARFSVPITVSIGCVLLTDEDFDSAYHKADAALYEAKQGGRNRHVIVGG